MKSKGEMILVHIVVSFVIILFMNCSEQQNKIESIGRPTIQRELLKEYFLCVCITEAFKDRQISELDISQGMYFDILRYAPETFQEIQAYARKFIKAIEPSPIVDLGNKRAIISSCIEKYKSKEIDEFIKSMNKYMLND